MNPSALLTDQEVADLLKVKAKEIGFGLIGITPAARPDSLEHFQKWVEEGRYGTMEYIPRREAAYEHPDHVLEGARSIIMLGMNYGPGKHGVLKIPNHGPRSAQQPASTQHHEDAISPSDYPATVLPKTSHGKIAAYAQGTADYHDVLKKKLKQLAGVLHEMRPDARTRAVIDTAPLLERDAARRAGLGWFGKNTMLINKEIGSYYFLGAILANCSLPADAPLLTDHCGKCTRCLDACPTQAFPEPHVLDAQKCISYLTIELRGQPIPRDLRTGMQDWLFGCDICQQVCPWNRKSVPPQEEAFRPSPHMTEVTARDFLLMDEQQFRAIYQKTPLSRGKREGLARNAAIVLGNSNDPTHLPALMQGANDPSPIVRGAAAWAIGQMGLPHAMEQLIEIRTKETDSTVLEEIDAALKEIRSRISGEFPIPRV